MPFQKDKIAKASAFQKNCALNCLAHVLVRNIKLNKIPEASLKALHQAFNTYYRTEENPLSFAQFKEAVQIDNPVHREVILGPVLRQMLGDPKVVGSREAGKNKKERFDQPGSNLEDITIVPLANFFGIRVESYSSLRVQACAQLAALEPLSTSELNEARIQDKIKELEEQMREGKINSEFEINALKTSDSEQVGRINGARVYNKLKVLPKDKIPVLKLYNKSGGHFEYEEESVKRAQEHNAAYDRNLSNWYDYGSEDGVPDLRGSPDAQLVRRKIGQKICDLDLDDAEIDFSAILTEYEEENTGRYHSSTDQNLFSSMFGGFSDMLGGAFSPIGKRIFQAFTAPFMNPAGKFDFGFKSTSDGWMGIFEGIMQFCSKIFEMMQGLASVAPEIGKAFESAQQGEQRRSKSKKAGSSASASGSANPFGFGSMPSPRPSRSVPDSSFGDLSSRFSAASGAFSSGASDDGSDVGEDPLASFDGSSSPYSSFTPYQQTKKQRRTSPSNTKNTSGVWVEVGGQYVSLEDYNADHRTIPTTR